MIDAAAPDRDEQIAAVDSVLEEIGASAIPQIRVYNKTDLAGRAAGVERDPCGSITAVRASALTGAGLHELKAALAERFSLADASSPTMDATVATGS